MFPNDVYNLQNWQSNNYNNYKYTLFNNIRAQKAFEKCGFKKVKDVTKENKKFISVLRKIFNV